MNKNKHIQITRHRGKSRGAHVSSIVNEVIKSNLKPFYFIFFTRKFHMHKKQKIHIREQKQKRQTYYVHKNI